MVARPVGTHRDSVYASFLGNRSEARSNTGSWPVRYQARPRTWHCMRLHRSHGVCLDRSTAPAATRSGRPTIKSVTRRPQAALTARPGSAWAPLPWSADATRS